MMNEVCNLEPTTTLCHLTVAGLIQPSEHAVVQSARWVVGTIDHGNMGLNP
jgi:hypothetical protein